MHSQGRVRNRPKEFELQNVVLPCKTPFLVSDMRGWIPFSWLGFRFHLCSPAPELKCPGAKSPSLHHVVKD